MKTKPILCPERQRHVPSQFSWIDQRLIRNHHIRGKSPRALALYLFLCTVADAEGISYYSDETTGKLLGWTSDDLRLARQELVGAGLIAYRRPFYQVLSLEPAPGGQEKPEQVTRANEVQSAGEVLRRILQKP